MPKKSDAALPAPSSLCVHLAGGGFVPGLGFLGQGTFQAEQLPDGTYRWPVVTAPDPAPDVAVAAPDPVPTEVSDHA